MQRRAALDLVREINVDRGAVGRVRVVLPVQQTAENLQSLRRVSSTCKVQGTVTGGVDHGRRAASTGENDKEKIRRRPKQVEGLCMLKATVSRIAPHLDSWFMLAVAASSEELTTAPSMFGHASSVQLQAANQRAKHEA